MRRVFHFVLGERMYNRLTELSAELDMSLSGLIKYIIQVCYIFLEQRHFLGMEEGFETTVGWTEHIQVYFNGATRVFYDLIKALHHNLDSYSMAQILRLAIQHFLDGVEEYGSVEDFVHSIGEDDRAWADVVRRNFGFIPRAPRIIREPQLCCNRVRNRPLYIMTYDYRFRLLSTRMLI